MKNLNPSIEKIKKFIPNELSESLRIDENLLNEFIAEQKELHNQLYIKVVEMVMGKKFQSEFIKKFQLLINIKNPDIKLFFYNGLNIGSVVSVNNNDVSSLEFIPRPFEEIEKEMIQKLEGKINSNNALNYNDGYIDISPLDYINGKFFH